MDKFIKNFIKNNSVDYGLFWVSIICFISSIFLPSLRVGGIEDAAPDEAYRSFGKIYYGWKIIIQGWAMIPEGNFAWMANILIVYPLFATKNYTKASIFVSISAFILSISAFILALTSLTIDTVPYDSIISTSRDNLNQFLIGFYFWIASFLLLAISNFLRLRKSDSIK